MRERFERYKCLLLEENKKINLVSRRCTVEELEMHVQDAIVAHRYWDFRGQQVVDVGSGGGFPGVPLAIACPEGMFTLVEADLKKSQFLQRAAAELGLQNVRVIRERAEVVGRDPYYRERFDFALARAVAQLNTLAEYALPLVRRGGLFLAWKGRNYEVEIEMAENALEILGGHLEEIKKYILVDSERCILAVRKVKPTLQRFPRRTGVPGKRPL